MQNYLRKYQSILKVIILKFTELKFDEEKHILVIL